MDSSSSSSESSSSTTDASTPSSSSSTIPITQGEGPNMVRTLQNLKIGIDEAIQVSGISLFKNSKTITDKDLNSLKLLPQQQEEKKQNESNEKENDDNENDSDEDEKIENDKEDTNNPNDVLSRMTIIETEVTDEENDDEDNQNNKEKKKENTKKGCIWENTGRSIAGGKKET